MPRLTTTTALALVLTIAFVTPSLAQTDMRTPAATQAAAPAERSDADLWDELKALSGSQIEDSLWDAAETATEQVFGSALSRDNGETVFETLEAAADGP